jgi:hypothetical protein
LVPTPVVAPAVPVNVESVLTKVALEETVRSEAGIPKIGATNCAIVNLL